MKIIALLIAGILLIGILSCKKSSNNNDVAPYYNLATLTATIGTDDSMRLVIHYTPNTTQKYYDFIVEVYYNDTFTMDTEVQPHDPGTNFALANSHLFLGGSYKAVLIVEKTGVSVAGNQIAIDSVSGN